MGNDYSSVRNHEYSSVPAPCVMWPLIHAMGFLTVEFALLREMIFKLLVEKCTHYKISISQLYQLEVISFYYKKINCITISIAILCHIIIMTYITTYIPINIHMYVGCHIMTAYPLRS